MDVNKPEENGYPALALAAYYGSVDVIRILLDAPGIEVNQQMADFATSQGHTEAANLIQNFLSGGGSTTPTPPGPTSTTTTTGG